MVIINGYIHTMEDEPIKCGYVHIKNNLIEEVGDMSDYVVDEKEEQVLDVKGGMGFARFN